MLVVESRHVPSAQTVVQQPTAPQPLQAPTLETKQETESNIETTPHHDVEAHTKQQSVSISETITEAQSSSRHEVHTLFEVGISHEKEIVKMLQQNLQAHVEQMREELSGQYGEAMLEHGSETEYETDAKTMFKKELEAIAEQIVETVLGEGLEQENLQEAERIMGEESKPMYEEERHIISVGEKEETIYEQEGETTLEEGLERTYAQEAERMLQEKPITMFEEDREIISVLETEEAISKQEDETILGESLERTHAQEAEIMLEEEYEGERDIIYHTEEEETLLEQESRRILEHETEMLSEREETMLQEEAYILSEQDSEMISEHKEADLFKQEPESMSEMMNGFHDEQHAGTTSPSHAHRCIFAMIAKLKKHLQESESPDHFVSTDSATDEMRTDEMRQTFQLLLAIRKWTLQ